MTNKDKVVALLQSIETGNPTPVGYINPEKYIQHNLAVGDGLAGFGAVMAHAPEGGFKVQVVRAFEDGDYVFTQSIYDFFGPKIGFDIFRFEDGLIVEHWDNLTGITPPNPSGRTQTDGTTEVVDLDKTEANREVVAGFVKDVLIGGKFNLLTHYINPKLYLQHNSGIADGLDGLSAGLKYLAENGLVMRIEKTHLVLAEGNFVLTVSEGVFGANEPSSFYDLFRVEAGQIVEHWDVIETIAPRDQWKNENGKF